MTDEAKDTIDSVANRAKSATDQAADAAKETSDALRDGAQRAQEGFSEHIVEPARRAGEAVKASGKKVAEGSAAVSFRLIDQAETNAHEAFAALRAAAGAKDVSEVMRIQGDYLREQSTRAFTQAREIGDLIVSFGKDAIAPLRGNQTDASQ